MVCVALGLSFTAIFVPHVLSFSLRRLKNMANHHTLQEEQELLLYERVFPGMVRAEVGNGLRKTSALQMHSIILWLGVMYEL